MSFINTLFGPLKSESNCSLFLRAEIGLFINIIFGVIVFIYLIYKNLGKSTYILIYTMISMVLSNIVIIYLLRILYGMCLKSLN